MAVYNINEFLADDNKIVQLRDGTELNLTFTPLAANKIYMDMVDDQSKIQNLLEKYRDIQKKSSEVSSEKDLEELKQFTKNSQKHLKEMKELRDKVEDKTRKIIKLVIDENTNEVEATDEFFDKLSKQEQQFLFQIIFDQIKEQDKKK